MKVMVKVASLVFLVVLVGLVSVGCGVIGGAEIRLDGLTLSSVDMEGKTITGLPSDKVNLVLAVSAQKVRVTAKADTTILTIEPSGATVEIKAGNIAIKGVPPEKIKVEWITSQQK